MTGLSRTIVAGGTGGDGLPHLFSPIDIGPLTLANRVVFASHTPGFSLDPSERVPGRRYGHYLARRAAGGAGLVITGHRYCFVRAVTQVGGQLGFVAGSNPFLWDPEAGGGATEEAYRSHIATIVSHVHAEGVPILAQLSTDPPRTAIAELLTRIDFLQLAPSPGSASTGLAARGIEVDEIHRLIAAAGRLASTVRESGLDGVELHCHAGDLANDFLSPAYNRRTDRYGGSLENRMRFITELLTEIRRCGGPGFVVALRFSLYDAVGGGFGLDEGIEILRRLDASGLVDEINVFGTFSGIEQYTADGQVEVNVAMTARAREALARETPIAVTGSISDPLAAERIIADGRADLVGMVRALIADPDAPLKAREGRSDEIRRCVYSSEGCLGLQGAWRAQEIMCTVNPEAGAEEEFAELTSPHTIKRVLVVGGGPAGLKAAEQAAMRGHSVVLFERDDQLGGRVLLQCRVPSRELERVAVTHLERRLEMLGVEVRCGQEATVENLLAENPDAIVLATGSTPVTTGYTNLAPNLPGLPGADRAFVVSDEAVLRDAPVGQRVVIVDDSAGDFTVPLTAEFLLDRGHEVEVCTRRRYIGHNMFSYSLIATRTRLEAKGLRVHPEVEVTEIGDRSVLATNVWSRAPMRLEDVDTVVLSIGRRSDRELRAQLAESGVELVEAGDSVLPRSVGAAIRDGYLLGRHI